MDKTEKEIRQVVREALTELAEEMVNKNRNIIYEGCLDEMGKINLHPQGREEVLPYPRFFVFVNNGDHNPPHIHVQKKDKTYHATFRG